MNTGMINYSTIGIGFAVTFAIIALSAITLYLAFRIKETFREEKSLKMQVAKVGFLIGILFLAGGMFYFFANAMYQPERFQNGTNTSGTIEFDDSVKNTSVVLGVSYPDNIEAADKYTVSFKVYNPFPRVIHNATIKLIGLSLLEAKSNFDIYSDNLKLGDVSPGETSGYLQLEAPSYPVTLEGALILKSEDITPVTEPVKINVLDINATPSPTPSPNATAPSSTERPWYYPDINIIWPSSSSSASTPTVTPMPSSTSFSNSTLTPTVSPTPTNTVNITSSPTESSTPTETPTSSPTANITSSPTSTPIPTVNITSSPTETSTSSPTATPTPTETSTSSPTESPTPTETPTYSPTETPTSSPTENPTSSPPENPKLPHKSIP